MTTEEMDDIKDYVKKLVDESLVRLDQQSAKIYQSQLRRFYITYALFGIVGLVFLVQGLNLS